MILAPINEPMQSLYELGVHQWAYANTIWLWSPQSMSLCKSYMISEPPSTWVCRPFSSNLCQSEMCPMPSLPPKTQPWPGMACQGLNCPHSKSTIALLICTVLRSSFLLRFALFWSMQQLTCSSWWPRQRPLLRHLLALWWPPCRQTAVATSLHQIFINNDQNAFQLMMS